jgi:hypothetical protein
MTQPKNRSNEGPKYTIKALDNVINATVDFLYYYRMVPVCLALIIIGYSTVHVWNVSGAVDKYRNVTTVFTCGSVVIAIFYAILNYENNQLKVKRDRKISRDVLAFNAAFEWYKGNIVEHLKKTKILYDTHKHLIEENKSKEFFEILEGDEAARSSLISILNYCECMAIAIEEDIMDEYLVKKFFCSIFKMYHRDYSFYIDYRRKKNHAPTAWKHFSTLAQKWTSEN